MRNCPAKRGGKKNSLTGKSKAARRRKIRGENFLCEEKTSEKKKKKKKGKRQVFLLERGGNAWGTRIRKNAILSGKEKR